MMDFSFQTKARSLLVAAAVASAAAIAVPGIASAAILSADFTLELDLPDIGSGPRMFEALGAPLGAGNELTLADEVSNPSGWAGAASIDLSSTGLVTLTGDLTEGAGDYDLARFSITNIVFSAGESITSVTSLLADLLDATFGLGQVAPAVSFTTNSLTVLFDTTGSGSAADFNFFDGGVSTFQLNFDGVAPVPLPAAGWLLLGGIGMLAAARRRNRSA